MQSARYQYFCHTQSKFVLVRQFSPLNLPWSMIFQRPSAHKQTNSSDSLPMHYRVPTCQVLDKHVPDQHIDHLFWQLSHPSSRSHHGTRRSNRTWMAVLAPSEDHTGSSMLHSTRKEVSYWIKFYHLDTALAAMVDFSLVERAHPHCYFNAHRLFLYTLLIINLPR